MTTKNPDQKTLQTVTSSGAAAVSGNSAAATRGSRVPSSGESPSPNLFVRRRRGGTVHDDALSRPTITYWKDAMMRIAENKPAVISLIFVAILAVVAIVVPIFLPYSYEEQEIWNKDAPPNLGFAAVAVADEFEVGMPADLTKDQLAEMKKNLIPGDPVTTPMNFRVFGEPTTQGIPLQWDPVPGAKGYRVWRSNAVDSLGIPLADLEAHQVSYLDRTSLYIGSTYIYRVVSFDDMNESDASSPLKVQPKLALKLDEARKFQPAIQPGENFKTWAHLIGTDNLGRDLLARLLTGARISLFIGFVTPLIFMLIGITYGCISGYFGGTVDNIMMRFADIVATIPSLLTVIMLQVVMGSGVVTLIVAMVITDWAGTSRQIRGEVLRIREMEFVHASKILGTSFWKVIFRHLLPNVMGTVLVLFTVAIPGAIFTEAFLSFIGLGIAPPLASWGTITREGARVLTTYPHELLIPAALICVTILAFNLLGDGMRDALDPKLRGAK